MASLWEAMPIIQIVTCDSPLKAAGACLSTALTKALLEKRRP